MNAIGQFQTKTKGEFSSTFSSAPTNQESLASTNLVDL